MSPTCVALAAVIVGASCSASGPPDVPSNTAGDTCVVTAFAYNDAGKCAHRDTNIPICYREAPPAVRGDEWMCTVSARGNLYIYPAPSNLVFYYPGWTFGPASRTRLQPAFESTLSAKDEIRCAEALDLQAHVSIGEGHIPYCAEPPGSPDKSWWPMATITVTFRGMTTDSRFSANDGWSSEGRWHIGHAPLTRDPGYAYGGMFYLRWNRAIPRSRGGGTHRCEAVGVMPPSVGPLDDKMSGYDLESGVAGCPRPATCEVNVTRLEGEEGYPTTGKFTARNLTRWGGDCADTVDVDGTFQMPRPAL
jgi:hypothetical protein